MLTYSELINLADQIEEEEEEEPIQTSILPPPQPKQSPEEEAQEESDLGGLNQFMANFYARKKLQRQADGPIIPKTKIGVETYIGRSQANIRNQIYRPASTSNAKKCNHPRITTLSSEKNSITKSGDGI